MSKNHRDLESLLLGSLIVEPDRMVDVAGIIEPGDFLEPENGRLYEMMVSMYATGGFDVQSLSMGLVGQMSPSVVVQHHNTVVTGFNAKKYAEEVAAVSLKRRLKTAALKVAASVDEYEDTDELLGMAQEEICSVGNRQNDQGFRLLGGSLEEILERSESIRKGDKKGLGLKTGFRLFDSLLGGVKPTNFIVIAARPGIGKTSFALNMLKGYYKAGYRVALMSLEMSGIEIATRLVSSWSGVPTRVIETGSENSDQLMAVTQAMGELHSERFLLDDKTVKSLNQLGNRVQRLVMQFQPDVLFIDYLGLIMGAPGRTRYEQVTNISNYLKSLAMQHKIVLVALSQLSREAAGGKPEMHHLRDSGQVEQDANAVILLHQEPNTDIVELSIQKNRMGEKGSMDFHFDKTTQTFREIIKE